MIMIIMIIMIIYFIFSTLILFFSHLLSSLFYSLSLLVVTQIRGHIAGSSPLTTTVRALHFHREKISALPSLVDSRQELYTKNTIKTKGFQDEEAKWHKNTYIILFAGEKQMAAAWRRRRETYRNKKGENKRSTGSKGKKKENIVPVSYQVFKTEIPNSEPRRIDETNRFPACFWKPSGQAVYYARFFRLKNGPCLPHVFVPCTSVEFYARLV